MVYSLTPGFSYGLYDGRAVVLDLVRDRYFRLGTALTRTLMELSAQTPPSNPDHIASLIACGLIVESDNGLPLRAVELAVPQRSALEIDPNQEQIGPSALNIAHSIFAVRLGLARCGFAKSLDRARRTYNAASLCQDDATAIRVAQAFMRVRAAVPCKRACVLDSLALSRLLVDRGLAHDVALGVKLAPFAAHAWVQTDNCILSDKVDPVAEFTAVFRL